MSLGFAHSVNSWRSGKDPQRRNLGCGFSLSGDALALRLDSICFFRSLAMLKRLDVLCTVMYLVGISSFNI